MTAFRDFLDQRFGPDAPSLRLTRLRRAKTSAMGWGLDLWDKEAEVKAQVEDGINFIVKARTFATELAKLESIFSMQFKKLVKLYFPATTCTRRTTPTAFVVHRNCTDPQPCAQAMLKCCDFIAEQHETLSTMIKNEVLEPMGQLQKFVETSRGQLYADVAKQNALHDKEHKALLEVQKRCDKAEKEAELARQAYDKVWLM